MIDLGDVINNYFLKTNGMFINHAIHFVEGGLAVKYPLIIPMYVIYQLYDSIDFNNLTNYPKANDTIILDLIIFCIGYWFVTFIQNYK